MKRGKRLRKLGRAVAHMIEALGRGVLPLVPPCQEEAPGGGAGAVPRLWGRGGSDPLQ